jgi:hypothetical protein
MTFTNNPAVRLKTTSNRSIRDLRNPPPQGHDLMHLRDAFNYQLREDGPIHPLENRKLPWFKKLF